MDTTGERDRRRREDIATLDRIFESALELGRSDNAATLHAAKVIADAAASEATRLVIEGHLRG